MHKEMEIPFEMEKFRTRKPYNGKFELVLLMGFPLGLQASQPEPPPESEESHRP